MESVRAIRAVVFDMDGLLLDTTPMLVAAYRATVLALTGRTIRDVELFEVWHHGTISMTLQELTGEPPSDADIEMHLTNIDESLSLLRPYVGVPEVVEAVAARVPVGVFTSSTRVYAERCLRACELDRFFRDHRLVANEDVVHPKPDGEGLRICSERFGVEVANIAYVGDAKNDMLAAVNAGCLAVAGRWGHYFDEEMPADVICNDPADVLTLLLPPHEQAFGRA